MFGGVLLAERQAKLSGGLEELPLASGKPDEAGGDVARCAAAGAIVRGYLIARWGLLALDTVAELDSCSGSSDEHDEVVGRGASHLANLGHSVGE